LDQDALKRLLLRLGRGELTVEKTLERLKHLPFEDLGFACVDHHRDLRKGLSEVIFAEGKRLRDILEIMERMAAAEENILVTRLSPEKSEAVCGRFPESVYHERSRTLTHLAGPVEISGKGTILVVSAGTSDIPVAEEAAVTAGFMGNRVETLYDLGVAGLHRLLDHMERIRSASVNVVAAGMEGALPSVVGGLVERPVIAVPTSVGYGANFQGLAALLGMLNTCAPGVTVVNIDNGFGAGYAAAVINRT